MIYSKLHLSETIEIIKKIDTKKIENMVNLILNIKKEKGRIFFLGVGGSASNCSHAVNDFRKIIGIESYTPTDNVSELTARINDDGWSTIFTEWLKISNLNSKDLIFVFSVGGGSLEKNISPNLVEALKYGQSIGCKLAGIVGRDGGYTNKVADVCVLVPTVNEKTTTPHTEAFQAVICHLIISHPKLKLYETKWESVSKK
jgi:D-sedoheptulose 7-phosphate isomerase|tara:strand:+ start:696 stop:1298 length:603 start_codon:yes stop_codon:yes gene_type:complete